MSSRSLLSLVALIAASLAVADPSIAAAAEPSVEVGGGGLAFAPNGSLTIETQDVVISPEKVALTYAIRNNATAPQTILIVFPLPDLDANIVSETDVVLPNADPQNFIRYDTRVDGQPVQLKVEQRAMVLGLDVSATLKSLDLPLFPYADGMGAKLDALDPAKRQELMDDGILKDDSGAVVPAWTLKSVAYWRQTFNASQTITISHGYQPIAGVADYVEEALPPLRQRSCLSEAAEAAIARLPPDPAAGVVKMTTVGYVAAPGADGLGPARRFRLIIESADPKTIVSTCREGLKKTGPIQMEWNAVDFVQDEDWQVLFAR